MVSRRLLGALFGGLLAAAALAQDEPVTSSTVAVDGVAVSGVIGYRIEFNRQPLPRLDSRRLDLAYSPDLRKFVLTVTQQGLYGLQEWINSATDSATPQTKVVTVITKNAKSEVITRWELTGVVFTTMSTATAGEVNQVTATMEFLFDRMRLVEARPN
jgi:hypothetical protein